MRFEILSRWSTWTLLVSMCIPYAFDSSGSGGWVDERKSRRVAATRRESAASGRAEDGAWSGLEIPGGSDKADANAFKQSCPAGTAQPSSGCNVTFGASPLAAPLRHPQRVPKAALPCCSTARNRTRDLRQLIQVHRRVNPHQQQRLAAAPRSETVTSMKYEVFQYDWLTEPTTQR